MQAQEEKAKLDLSCSQGTSLGSASLMPAGEGRMKHAAVQLVHLPLFNNAQKSPNPNKQLLLTLAGKVGISVIPPSCWSFSTFV